MATLEVVEQLITNRIEDDLRKKDDFASDPLGYCVYLFFLLKNGVRSPEVENLTDWMNIWVDDVINRKNLTRFVDRDFSSALFAYYCLKKFGRLKTKIQPENLRELSSSYVESNRFFDSFTLSAIIILAMSEMKDNIENYSNVVEWLKNEVDHEIVFNDGKNLIFASIFFEELGSEDYLRRIVDYCWGKLIENSVPSYDELFFAWILWKFKKLREEKDLPKIREFTDTTIKNASKFLREEPVSESIKEIYGLDIKTKRIGFGLSKIAVGVYLDILKDFIQRTVRVTKEELSRKDIPTWIRSSSIIASVLLFSDALILWTSFGSRIVRKVSLDITDITWDSFLPAAGQYLINVCIFLSVISFAVISISLLWDISYKGYTDPKTVKENLKQRLKNRYLDIFVILLTVVAGLFGV